jgi:hypothetical protein
MSGKMEEMRARQEEATMRIDGLLSTVNMLTGGDTALSDNRTMQDLDAGFEEVHQNLTQLEARQSMWTMTQVMPIREEVTELRNNINMIRMHVNWLLNRSREEGRIRAANNAGSSGTIRRDGSADVPPVMPERRRSSGAEADLPRLWVDGDMMYDEGNFWPQHRKLWRFYFQMVTLGEALDFTT